MITVESPCYKLVSKRLDQYCRPGFSPAMRRIMAVSMGMLVCIVAGCMRGAPENNLEVTEVAEVLVTPEVLHMGRTAYRKYCVQCHGYSLSLIHI